MFFGVPILVLNRNIILAVTTSEVFPFLASYEKKKLIQHIYNT